MSPSCFFFVFDGRLAMLYFLRIDGYIFCVLMVGSLHSVTTGIGRVSVGSVRTKGVLGGETGMVF